MFLDEDARETPIESRLGIKEKAKNHFEEFTYTGEKRIVNGPVSSQTAEFPSTGRETSASI